MNALQCAFVLKRKHAVRDLFEHAVVQWRYIVVSCVIETSYASSLCLCSNFKVLQFDIRTQALKKWSSECKET
jgi:hypothetical protein